MLLSSHLLVMSQTITAQGYRRAEKNIRRDQRDHFIAQLTLAGGVISGETAYHRLRGVQDSVSIADFARPFALISGPAKVVHVMIERRLLEVGRPLPKEVHGMMLPPRRAALLGDYIRAVVSRPRGTVFAARRLEEATAAVMRACLDPVRGRSEIASQALAPIALARAKQVIAARPLYEDLAPEVVAAAIGVSRATLYRLFQPFGGVGQYIWERRLEAARQAICGGDRRRLADIAADCGFTDEAHFSRSFRELFGVRPSDLRPLEIASQRSDGV
jgi:AraC-like DNA-binding protein